MSSPPVGYYDVYADGKVVNGPYNFLNANKLNVDVTFSLNDTFADTAKLNVLAFDYDFRSADWPFSYELYDAPGVTLLAHNGMAFALQGSDLSYTFGRFTDVDVMTTTNKADTLILSGDQGPKAIFTGAGNDYVEINGYQALTDLGRGSDTFISTDNIADFVLAGSYKGEVFADRIMVSAGSLVILSTTPGESNSNVYSATGNLDDITVITEDKFEEEMIENPLGFMLEHDDIDIGRILAAAQDKLLNAYPTNPTFVDGVMGQMTDQGNFIPHDAAIYDLLWAFNLTNQGKFGDAINVLETEMDMSFGVAASLVADLSDTYGGNMRMGIEQQYDELTLGM